MYLYINIQKITFSKDDSLLYSNLSHRSEQKPHITIQSEEDMIKSYELYGGIENKICPGNVFEYTINDGKPKLNIHCENCLHCKGVCVKSRNDFIKWNPPEGGSGPEYDLM